MKKVRKTKLKKSRKYKNCENLNLFVYSDKGLEKVSMDRKYRKLYVDRFGMLELTTIDLFTQWFESLNVNVDESVYS